MAPASKPAKYNAVTTYSKGQVESSKKFSSRGKDENAILVTDEAFVALEDASITRKSASSTGGDSASFYGVGAAALVTGGQLYIQDSTVSTSRSEPGYGPDMSSILPMPVRNAGA